MDKSLVSVIVPVYNVENYLEKCVNSILKQTYQTLDVILVDDGSTDGSAELCDQLEAADERVRVVHKKNGGVVSARREGLEHAKGKYAILIDSDDWIEKEMIADLYKVAIENKADMVTSGYYREQDTVCGIETDEIKEGIYCNVCDKRYLFKNLIYCGNFERTGISAFLWCKLIKKDLLKDVHEDINEKITYAEDAAIIYSCCVRAKTIVVTHKVYYHYVMRVGSAVYGKNEYYYRNINELYVFLKKEFEKNEFKDVLMRQLDTYMTSMVLRGLSHFLGLSGGTAIPYYDFDKTVLEKGTRIVLYGAGRVGKSYYKQIGVDKLFSLVGWTDKEYLYYRSQDLDVSSPEELRRWKYDYILLAFQKESLSELVKKELIDLYGIREEKIIWLKPINIIDKYNLLDL